MNIMVVYMKGFKKFGESKLIKSKNKYLVWHVPQNLVNLLELTERSQAEIYVILNDRAVMLKFKESE